MSDQLEQGQVIAERYVVEALVGVGGIAEVYRVRHLELGSVHALKLLTWRRKQLAVRFEREGRFQAQLGHPNVVTVTDFLRFEGQVALVMEFVDGPTLERYLAEQGALSPQDAFALFVPMLAAVAAAHDRQVWHRDLKPANVLLARTPVGWVPKVADFGIAKFITDELGSGTSTGMAMGSPGYMAPEQVRDSSTVDQRADIFALGAILFEMLTGRKAFADPDGGVSFASTLDRDPPAVDGLGVEPQVAEAIQKAMAQRREDRFEDCRAFARALGVAAHPLLVDLGEGRPVASGVTLSPAANAALSSTMSGPSSYGQPTPMTSAVRTATRWIVVPFVAGTLVVVAMIAIVGFAAVLSYGIWERERQAAVEVAPPPPVETVVPEPSPATAAVAEPAPVGIEAPPPEPEPAPSVAAVEGTPDETQPDPAPAAPVVVEVVPPEPAPVVTAPPQPLPPAPVIPAPAVATVPKPPPFDPMTVLGGTWKGRADKAPFELRFIEGSGTNVTAQATFIAGVSSYTHKLFGSYDRATGTLKLQSDGGELLFNGMLTDRSIAGTYQAKGKYPQEWSVSR